MQEDLANKLLASVLRWNSGTARQELRPLLHLARLKYDTYQQYSAGRRFIESLALWLDQFTTPAEKQLAYDLFSKRGVFISAAELEHLVQMAYPDVLRPRFIAMATSSLPRYQVVGITSSAEYALLLARTLYVGLSDGAQTGLFRIYNPGVVEHEQMLLTYQSDDEKRDDLFDHLKSSVTKYIEIPTDQDCKFQAVVLLDDFTASGLSFFRWDDTKQKYTGKLVKALDKLVIGAYSSLMNAGGFRAIVCFYVATAEAISKLQAEVNEFAEIAYPGVTVEICAVHSLPESVAIVPGQSADIDALLQKYFDDSVVTKHWSIAKSSRGWLGYDECGLLVVLHHNTPNNTVPLLWFGEENRFAGLFPRTSRHVA
jgi:hypothetical protein